MAAPCMHASSGHSNETTSLAKGHARAVLQVTSEAGSQANEAREALKGSARGLGSLHEVISGMADLMAHDQLSSAASQVSCAACAARVLFVQGSVPVGLWRLVLMIVCCRGPVR